MDSINTHAAAYALVAYQTAYLKAHHPAAFMAATLSGDLDNTDKVRIFYADTLLQNISRAATRCEQFRLCVLACG